MDAVRMFTLKNKGAFLVQLQIEWSAGAAHGIYKPSGSFCVGAECSVDLANAAEIPQGASVRLKADVAGNRKDLAAAEQFTYSAKYGGSVVYTAKGTSVVPYLNKEKQDTKHIEFGAASLYQCLQDGILSAFPALRKLDHMRFQFTAAPMTADWDQTSYAVFYDLADAVPGDMGGFYTVGSGHISQAYTDLLNCIATGVGEDDPEYQRLEDQHKTTAALYNQTVSEATDAFLLAKHQGSTAANDLTEWLGTVGGKAYQRKLNQLEVQMKDYEDAMAVITKRLREPLERAQAALLSDRMNFADGTHSIITVPRTVIGGNLLEDTMRWKKLASNYRQGLKIGFDLNLSIVPTVRQSAVMDAAMADYRSNGIESVINFEKLILDEHYSMTLKVIGFNSYPVVRGAWYDDTFVNKDVKLYETSGFHISHFFGANGVLRLIPVMMIAAYHPILELTVSKSAYEAEIQQQLASCRDGYQFCGFVMDGSKTPAILKDTNLVTLTLEAADTQPAQLIGVISTDKTA